MATQTTGHISARRQLQSHAHYTSGFVQYFSWKIVQGKGTKLTEVSLQLLESR